jgi:hypothetical protein
MKSESEQKALERKEKLAGALVCLVAILFDRAVFTLADAVFGFRIQLLG